MKRNPERTPNSQIVSALRRLWLRSRERQAALKRDGYTCQKCGRKQSRVRGLEVYVEEHHLDGCDMKAVAEAVRAGVLHDPARLVTLCRECHGEETEGEK